MDTLPNGIRASIKALKETVAPALDAGNPLANEQLRLACAYLELVANRITLREQRLRSELDEAVDLASKLLPYANNSSPPVLDALRAGLDAAGVVQKTPGANEEQIVQKTQRLLASVSALARSCVSLPMADARVIERIILHASNSWLNTRRAWFSPLGFDPEAKAFPLPFNDRTHTR